MTELEALFRVALAVICGAVIGFDREVHAGSAGLRTHILVALGAATFTVLSVLIIDYSAFEDVNASLDPTRVLAAIISGIGFLGGAIVFRDENRTRNVTTAAGIWGVTAVGIAVGLGYYILAGGVTVLIISVLYLLKVGARYATHTSEESDSNG